MSYERVPNRVHFTHIWHRRGSRSQISLGRALYMPDKLNLHIGAGEKKKVSPRHFPTVVPELIQSLR